MEFLKACIPKHGGHRFLRDIRELLSGFEFEASQPQPKLAGGVFPLVVSMLDENTAASTVANSPVSKAMSFRSSRMEPRSKPAANLIAKELLPKIAQFIWSELRYVKRFHSASRCLNALYQTTSSTPRHLGALYSGPEQRL